MKVRIMVGKAAASQPSLEDTCRMSNHTKMPIWAASMERMRLISISPEAYPSCRDPTMSLTTPFFAGLRMVAWTEKTQNQKTAISMFSYLKHRNMAPSTRICRKDMNWMMRALQKQSASHPTKGENRM